QKLCVPFGNGTVVGKFHTSVKENRWQNCSKCGDPGGGSWAELGDSIGDFFGPGVGLFPSGKMLSNLLGDYCTKQKCEALGDCYFHEDLSSYFEIGTPVGSCDPIYPPGMAASKCLECGGGGDAIWNLCTRAECYSQGDCTFNGANVFTKVGTFMWFWPGLAVSERIKFTITECIITTTIECMLLNKKSPACLLPENNNFLKCVVDRISAYGIYSLPWITSGKMIEKAWSVFGDKVENIVIEEATKEIKKKITGEENKEEKG
ncbi:MAG: hypothetical protein NZ889_01870, partial [Candidatus Pacearchaeota archaeon]|nr:hypothetical protein [Candidatus Pacearchaeota archaeon]